MTGPRKNAVKDFCVRKIHERGPMDINTLMDLLVDSRGARVPSKRVVSGWLSTDHRLRKDARMNAWVLKTRLGTKPYVRWDSQ